MSEGILIGSCLLLACGIGCGNLPTDTTDSARQAILGGELSGPEEDAVIQLVSNHETGIHRCTGALLAPNLVLTARHCVANHVAGDFECDPSGELISETGGKMGAVIAPEGITVRVGTEPAQNATDALGAQVFALQTATMCRNDIALVVLDRSLPIQPILPVRFDRSATRGERVLTVGYGVFLGNTGFGIRHRKPDLIVTKVSASQFNPNGDDIPPRSFQLDGGSLCVGDSGGPAIADSGTVIGVYSKSNGECTSTATVNWYTETAPFFEELIRPAFVAAGAEPLLEVDPGAAGAATDQGGFAGATGTYTAGSAGANGGRTVAVVTAGTNSEPIGAGGTSTASESTDIIYEGSPPGGGTCNCRTAGSYRGRSVWFFALLTLLHGFRRSRRRH